MSTNKVACTFLRNGSVARLILCSDHRVYCETHRNLHASTENRFRLQQFNKVEAKLAGNQKPDWNRAVSEAEKIVGYPTSFLSLRWLLSDEIANVALHLRKLVGSNHPLLKTAKSVIFNGRNHMQAWGLIVLLISKAAGHLNVDDMEEDKAAGVLHSQRALAEVTEMIRTSHLVHKGLINIGSGAHLETSELNDMNVGNKIALLSGDYLLANSCAELANLRNQEIVELMSSAVRDLAEAEFIGRRDSQNNPLPSVPSKDCTDYAVEEWTLRNVLSAGALLGKSCKGTLKLAGHSNEIQEQGYNFGKHLALAWQACLDLGPFITKDQSVTFNLCSAPVMFHIEHDPSILTEIDRGLDSVNNVDYTKVREIILMGPGVELTKQLQKRHSQRAMEVLSVFEKSDARTALYNIIAAMGDF
ncbi:PREDICTED: decaprenyl-diphosphate synthase subunit 2 [Dufourea novaeangliae]|uniref:Decaprenyl-diphosphate synthase subunit 2 n=1 Tax=Dufourea novaeangliae TaxID=178035 RepID=A0A154PCA2_DUFNO|nr:PREDICTED: decaprenyl-diphosphate synthase subunit 2 [Dufourea novaeangliae]KZC09559.1 Decaprenyl-diphosphate synthase subunit 2 [Dufourea novaeangliae]